MNAFVKFDLDALSDTALRRAARRGAGALFLLPWLLAFAKQADDDGRLTVKGAPADPEDLADAIPCSTPAMCARALEELAAPDLAVLVRDPDGALRFAAWGERAGAATYPSDTPARRAARKRQERERRRGAAPTLPDLSASVVGEPGANRDGKDDGAPGAAAAAVVPFAPVPVAALEAAALAGETSAAPVRETTPPPRRPNATREALADSLRRVFASAFPAFVETLEEVLDGASMAELAALDFYCSAAPAAAYAVVDEIAETGRGTRGFPCSMPAARAALLAMAGKTVRFSQSAVRTFARNCYADMTAARAPEGEAYSHAFAAEAERKEKERLDAARKEREWRQSKRDNAPRVDWRAAIAASEPTPVGDMVREAAAELFGGAREAAHS